MTPHLIATLFLFNRISLNLAIPSIEDRNIVQDFVTHPDMGRCDISLFEDGTRETPQTGVKLDRLNRPFSHIVTPTDSSFEFTKTVPVPPVCSLRILNMNENNTLRLLLEFWKMRQTINAYTYLIFSEEDQKDFLDKDYRIKDFYHMFISTGYEKAGIYFLCLFCNADNWEKIASIEKSDGVLTPKRFEDFNGGNIRVSFTRIGSAILAKIDQNQNYSAANFYGSEFSLMSFIAEGLNFKMSWIFSKNGGSWGNKVGTEWTGVIGDLDENNADLGIGQISITAARSVAADFSILYREEKFGLISQIPFALPKWSAIFWPYKIEVWYGIGLSCLIFGPVFFGYLRLIKDSSSLDLQSCIFQSAKALFIQPLSKWPAKMSAKLMFTFWCFYAMVIDIAYSGSLISSLTLPARSQPVDSFKDLLRSNSHNFAARNNSLVHFILNSSSDPLFKAIWEKVQDHGIENSLFPTTNFSMILQNENMVMASDLGHLKLRVKLEYSTRAGESVFYVGKEGVYPSGLGIPMRKNAPYASVINEWITRAGEFGLHKCWLDRAIRRNIQLRSSGQTSDPETMLLVIKMAYFAFGEYPPIFFGNA